MELNAQVTLKICDQSFTLDRCKLDQSNYLKRLFQDTNEATLEKINPVMMPAMEEVMNYIQTGEMACYWISDEMFHNLFMICDCFGLEEVLFQLTFQLSSYPQEFVKEMLDKFPHRKNLFDGFCGMERWL